MAHLLALPFRLSPGGVAVTVEQGTDNYYKQQLTAIVLTLKGERPINVDFGLPDGAFRGFPHSAFYSQVTEHLPEITLLDILIEDESDMTQSVAISFDAEQR